MKTIKKFSLVGAVAVAMFAFSACDDSSSAGGDETETSALSSSAKVTEHLSSLGGTTSSSNVIANPEVVKQSSSSLVDPISSSNFQGDKLSSSNSGKQSESSSSSAGKVNCSALLEGETGWSWDVPKECRFNPDIDYGTMTDERDGQVYRTVKIGKQIWMAQNLNYETRISYCAGETEEAKAAFCSKYGRLYIWATAVGKPGSECSYGHECTPLDSGNIQGVCPTGWHLPSWTEWEALIVAVDGNITEYVDENNVAGKALKSKTGWADDERTVPNDDTYSFAALPAGHSFGEFHGEGTNAYFWSSSPTGEHVAIAMELVYCYDYAIRESENKQNGYSVRCVKDSE